MLISDDYISLYTPNKQASQIVYILKKYTDKNWTIVDANAGMGGNSIYFCKHFKYVYCIEILKQAINYLEHNLKDYDNKFIINDSCLDILKIIKYDIVFFDPPWGGSNYKYKSNVNLFLDNININTIIDNLYTYKNIKLVCLKAPYNFNLCESKWPITKVHNIYKNDNQSILFKFIIYKKK